MFSIRHTAAILTAAALLAAPAAYAKEQPMQPAQQEAEAQPQPDRACIIIANIAGDTMKEYQDGKSKSAAARALTKKYVDPVRETEFKDLFATLTQRAVDTVYSKTDVLPKGKTEQERYDNSAMFARVAYTGCMSENAK